MGKASTLKEQKEQVFDAWEQHEKDRARIAKQLIDGSRISYEPIKPTLQNLWRTERIVWMIETIVSSNEWKRKRPFIDISFFYKQFGDIVRGDWMAYGIYL